MGHIKREAGKCLISEMTSFTEGSMECYVLDIERGAGKCLTSEMTSFTEGSMECHDLDIDRFIDKDIKTGQIKREAGKC